MMVYELMSKLIEMPAGAEVWVESVDSANSLVDYCENALPKDNIGGKVRLVIRNESSVTLFFGVAQ